ncbi:neutral invertase [Calothrix parasitica NIES-267]|uniref:beta-fructofuranosidase n=1 Tax=Calothrix parasitica NIES-267 TaxID=1973488 RepID=A0A1Z4LTY3_9CYAN|nr:neutral invertase [Calothrix parasitica NIES-267]
MQYFSPESILNQSIIYYQGKPVGTLAAKDTSRKEASNYNQCFVRDFVSAAILFLIINQIDIVRNFLELTLKLQPQSHPSNSKQPARGLIPASFKVIALDDGEEYIKADYGDYAIGGVVPVDSCLWWIILLHAYVRATDDYAFTHQPQFQKGIRMITELCMAPRFDSYPGLFVLDGSCTIDRRMGIEGFPIEIQVLFYSALSGARELLTIAPENKLVLNQIDTRIVELGKFIHKQYWIDSDRLTEINRFRNDEYCSISLNEFNIYPASIVPYRLNEWLPPMGGYFAGNAGVSNLDIRFFSLGNLLSIVFELTTKEQSQAIMNLIEERWDDLIGEIPMKMCFPALEGKEYQLLTGCDPKNVPWSYHNGGNWPVLLWVLVAAAIKTNRILVAEKAIQIAQLRLEKDEYPEYYDGKSKLLIGREARLFQTWTVSGFLLAKELIRNPSSLKLFGSTYF